MTNKEKFIEVFGDNPKRHYITKPWEDEEYVPPIIIDADKEAKMTTEEAIDYNKNLKMYMRLSDKNQPCKFLEENYIALDMAIKALEQESVLDKIKTEIKEWYWQADKQALAKDPCVVDAMIDLFIRTINKYKAESEEEE